MTFAGRPASFFTHWPESTIPHPRNKDVMHLTVNLYHKSLKRLPRWLYRSHASGWTCTNVEQCSSLTRSNLMKPSNLESRVYTSMMGPFKKFASKHQDEFIPLSALKRIKLPLLPCPKFMMTKKSNRPPSCSHPNRGTGDK